MASARKSTSDHLRLTSSERLLLGLCLGGVLDDVVAFGKYEGRLRRSRAGRRRVGDEHRFRPVIPARRAVVLGELDEATAHRRTANAARPGDHAADAGLVADNEHAGHRTPELPATLREEEVPA